MATDESESHFSAQLSALRIDPERKLPKRNRFAGVFLVFIGVLVGMAISFVLKGKQPEPTPVAGGTGTSNAPTTGGVPSAPVKPPVAQQGDVILTATGYVTPRHRVSLSPQVMGQVVWVGVEKGDSVKKDQVLVRLDDAQYKARLAQAEARVVNAQAKLAMMESGSRKEDIASAKASVTELEAVLIQSQKNLDRMKAGFAAGGVASQQQLDDAQGVFDATAGRLASARALLAREEAGYRAEEIAMTRAELAEAEASTEEMRIQLEDTIIKAPSDGTILEKLVEVGELVTPQSFGGTRGARTELLSLADLSELQVEVDITESDFQKIKMQNPAKVILDAYPDKNFDGFIREIAPEADRQKATIQVKVAIKNPDALVRPEMSARVDFVKPAN